MAKAAAKGRRARRGSDEARSKAGSALVSEASGLLLLGLAALAALALGSYSPEDPKVPWPLGQEVANQAGPVGASLAFALFWLMDMGAVVFVAATAFLGGSLVLGQGVPPLKSRFWLGLSLIHI